MMEERRRYRGVEFAGYVEMGMEEEWEREPMRKKRTRDRKGVRITN